METTLEVLVAEDNELNRKVISAYFGVLGTEFDIAVDGKDALDKMSSKQYDLVLMDVQMPQMSGIEVVAATRSSPAPHPWLVAVTASAMEGAREKYISAGFDEYLPKPLRLEELEALLDRRTVAAAA